MAGTGKGRKGTRPAPDDPELRALLRRVREVARDAPLGWGAFAELLRRGPDVPPERVFRVMAVHLGRQSLPLLRGAALDDDERLAAAALGALPLLGTRAAGEVLVEAYRAHPGGERARLAWQGVEALRARGVNVSVPEPDGVRREVPEFELRGCWESLADPVGTREATARFTDRYGVWHSLMAAWNDRAGLKEVLFLPMGQRQWRELLQDQQDTGLVLVPCPLPYLQWTISRAREINRRTHFVPRGAVEEWDRLVGPPPPGYTPPDPVASRATPGAPEPVGSADELELLEGFIPSWAFEPADCRPWGGRFFEAGRDESGDEALFAAVARALATPELRRLYRDRLADVARLLEWKGEAGAAQEAALCAAAIDAGTDAGSMPFFQELAARGLLALDEMLECGEDPEALRYRPLEPIP